MSLMAELGEGPVPGPVPEPVPARLPPPPVEQNRQIVTERERPPPRQSTAPLPPPPMQVCCYTSGYEQPKITRIKCDSLSACRKFQKAPLGSVYQICIFTMSR